MSNLVFFWNVGIWVLSGIVVIDNNLHPLFLVLTYFFMLKDDPDYEKDENN